MSGAPAQVSGQGAAGRQLSVEVREPLPRLQARVEQMVLDAGLIPCAGDADIVLLCADAPNEGWDPTPGTEGAVLVASAIRPAALAEIDAVTTLTRPFDQAALAQALTLAAEAVHAQERAEALAADPLAAAASEIAESIDVLAALDDDAARTEAVLTMLRGHLGDAPR